MQDKIFLAKRLTLWIGPAVLALSCAPSEPAVQIDTNRRVVMETTSAPRGASPSGSPSSPSQGETSVTQYAVTDRTGTITTQVILCGTGTPAAHNVLRCTVPSGLVLVGGGAWAKWSGAGGLLTASYPFDAALTTWEARSQDHGVSDPHLLFVYAIGMQLNGVSRDALKTYLTLTTATAGPTAHPGVTVKGPANELLLGGGAKIESPGAGNLLTVSRPKSCLTAITCPDWIVAGSDHVYSDPGTITGYAITIKQDIAGFGHLIVNSAGVSSDVKQTLPASVSFDVPDGYALTGLGAETSWVGAGRLLTRIGTADMLGGRRLIFEDKDHLLASAGSITGFMTTITRAP